MKITEYTRKISALDKDGIKLVLSTVIVGSNDIVSAIKQLQETDIDVKDQINSWVVTSGLEKVLNASGNRFKGGVIEAIELAAIGAGRVIKDIEKIVNDDRQKIWDGNVIDIRRANLLNIVEYVDFWVSYTRLLLDTLITLKIEKTTPEKHLNRLDFNMLNGAAGQYRSFTVDLLKGSRHIISLLNDLPEVEVGETEVEIVEASQGKASVDLIGKGFGIHLVNPVFWIKLSRSKIQLYRIELMRSQNEVYASKIAQAEYLQRTGTTDPNIQWRINELNLEYTRNIAKIDEIRRSYD